MTLLADNPNTLVGQDTDLLRRLQEVVKNHPAASGLQLLIAPAALVVADDEVLVQRFDADRRVVELHPRKLADVSLTDVLHTPQVTGVTDEAYSDYAATPHASNCWTGSLFDSRLAWHGLHSSTHAPISAEAVPMSARRSTPNPAPSTGPISGPWW